ncbi:MAG TPA: DNA primase [Rickettsiales bacterium]|nr:DNA primase [Rickettsiales bacterium]
MRFPSEFIERLRHHTPLSQVIGKRMPVKRHGREFHGLCPFHKEKSPSFTVNDEKGFFHCFGCGAHGDAIGFIKDYEGISYIEAVERLAGEVGMQVPQMTREAKQQEQKRHSIEDTVALAAKWFVHQLSARGGEEARHYLADRALGAAMVEQFGLGYAPAGREELKSALMKQGISEAMLIEAGLLAKADDGRTYDRFRGRLMFPIRNARGVIVAFGGRILPSQQSKHAAKYLNSPETPIFKKGEMLFAYDIASRAARETNTMIVAEGYMDVIALHQAGFTTAVAPLGTAVTEPQLRLLWRAVPEPIFCLDGDAAGARAMKRAAELAIPLLKPGHSLRLVSLTGGDDPDSLIKRAGPSAMRTLLAQSKVLSHFLWESAVTEIGTETPEKRAMLEQHLLKTADAVADTIVKQHLRDYFKGQMNVLKRPGKFAKAVLPPVKPGVLPDENDTEAHLGRLEEEIAGLMIQYPFLLHHPDIEEHFAHMDFTQPVLDKIRCAVLEIGSVAQGVEHAALCAALAERGFSEKVKTILQQNNVVQAKLRGGAAESPEAAVRAFEMAYCAYSDKKLDNEIKEASGALERDSSEQNFNRLQALQKQRDELHRSRYVVTSEA